MISGRAGEAVLVRARCERRRGPARPGLGKQVEALWARSASGGGGQSGLGALRGLSSQPVPARGAAPRPGLPPHPALRQGLGLAPLSLPPAGPGACEPSPPPLCFRQGHGGDRRSHAAAGGVRAEAVPVPPQRQAQALGLAAGGGGAGPADAGEVRAALKGDLSLPRAARSPSEHKAVRAPGCWGAAPVRGRVGVGFHS